MEKNDGTNGASQERSTSFGSLSTLRQRWKDGTFGEILDDWRWIMSYSKRYKGAIIFYTLMGLLSSTLGLISSIASRHVIDIVVSTDRARLGEMVIIMLATAAVSLTFTNVNNRISTKLAININNDIQADIFDKIINSDWMAINKYRNGDVLNRFNHDIDTVATNAVSWIPNIIISLYTFMITFIAIWSSNKIMALMAFGTAPVMLIMSKFVIRKQREYLKQVKETRSHLTTFEVETFYNMDTIKSFGITVYGIRILPGTSVVREDDIRPDDLLHDAEEQSRKCI